MAVSGHAVLLSLHIAAGSAGLLIGPVAMAARKRRGLHTRAGIAYQAAVALMTGTALVMTALEPSRLAGLGVIAVATEAAALRGWYVRRRQRPGWLPVHISLMAGSYISFVTAALVVNWPSPIAWVLPTLIGSPLIAWAVRRATAPRVSPRVARQGRSAEKQPEPASGKSAPQIGSATPLR